MNCLYCDEPCDRVSAAGQTLHKECEIRMVAGSIGHQLKLCSCYGGDIEDLPGMTKHEAAQMAAMFFLLGGK